MKRHPLILSTLLCSLATLCCTVNSEAATSIGVDTDMYFRLIWGMLVVIGVMLVIYAIVRKKFSILHNREEHKIKILEIRPLMPKKSLCLVEVGGNQYLLGLSGEGITHIANVNDSSSLTFSEHLAEVTLSDNDTTTANI